MRKNPIYYLIYAFLISNFVIWWVTRLEAETSLSITRIMCFGERHNREHSTFQTISHMVLWGHITFTINFHRLFSLWWFIKLYDIINFRITWLLIYITKYYYLFLLIQSTTLLLYSLYTSTCDQNFNHRLSVFGTAFAKRCLMKITAKKPR